MNIIKESSAIRVANVGDVVEDAKGRMLLVIRTVAGGVGYLNLRNNIILSQFDTIEDLNKTILGGDTIHEANKVTLVIKG